MEVRPGYKQTEVGVIPEDWEVKPIGDFVSISVGRDLKEENYSDFQDDIFKYPVFSNTVANEGLYGFYKVSEYNGDSLTIVGRGVGLGTAFKRSGGYGAIGRLLVLFPQKDVDAGFLMEYINHRVKIFTESGGIPQLTGLSIAKYRIPLAPSRAEQEAIAEVLSDADALIESLEQLIAKKRNLKQGTMQELLTGRKRLPGFEVNPDYKQTEVGVIPEDWEIKCLGELFQITSSKRVFQSEWKAEGIPFYRARELAVLGEKGSIDNDLFISKEMYEVFRNTYGVPRPGDMLVTGVGTLGKVYVVSGNHEFYFKDGNIIWFKISGKVISNFIKQLYLTQLIVKQIEDASAGTTVGTYTISGAKKTTIPFPRLAEQEAIAEVLSDIDAEITALYHFLLDMTL